MRGRPQRQRLLSGARIPTPKELLMISMYETGSTLEEVGKAVSLTRERVRQILDAFGCERKYRHGAEERSAITRTRMRKEWEGWARQLGEYAEGTVVRRVFGLPPSVCISPLKEEFRLTLFRRILHLWNEGFNLPELMRGFNRSKEYICQTLHRAREMGMLVRQAKHGPAPGRKREKALCSECSKRPTFVRGRCRRCAYWHDKEYREGVREAARRYYHARRAVQS